MDQAPGDPAVAASELLEAVGRERDRAAFASLFAYFAPRVKAYMRRMGADDSLAEELAQDALLTVWHRAVSYDRHRAAASTWIFTIARNKRIDALRRERWPSVEGDDPASLPDEADSADRVVDAAQRAGLLQDALGSLPDTQRDLLHRAYFDEKSHSHIAHETGLPLGTVKSRLRLALQHLKAHLEDSGS